MGSRSGSVPSTFNKSIFFGKCLPYPRLVKLRYADASFLGNMADFPELAMTGEGLNVLLSDENLLQMH